MNAAVLEGVNLPLQLKSVDAPSISDREALVKLHAAALNHRDLWIQKGQYAGLKFPIILGSDGAGVVVECADASWIGKDVVINPSLDWGERETAQQKSFRILGLPDNGTFAEFVKVPIQNLCEKPKHLSWTEAAALPLAGLTAYRALFSRAGLKPKEKVLITGIGGGVALFGLQFALAIGADVWVTSGSDDKIAKAIALGAKGGANYNDANWDSELKSVGFDVILDSAGGDGFLKLIELAAMGGRIVFVGATKGAPSSLPMTRVFWKQLSILGSTMGSPKDFSQMLDLVNAKRIVPIVSDVLSLSAAEQGLRKMDGAAQFGKIVLQII
ncbi:MAG: zinc-binding dehydrogenase [Chloroherpetonaceae bacterium]|nr:zinc-binding dehydrogenase [Chloroherpetonaceae bacterium]MDW8438167.1 zinc-binding dehydrogenase [Chloroherpetonaceae bacterium]